MSKASGQQILPCQERTLPHQSKGGESKAAEEEEEGGGGGEGEEGGEAGEGRDGVADGPRQPMAECAQRQDFRELLSLSRMKKQITTGARELRPSQRDDD
jgi:hypothetical protein